MSAPLGVPHLGFVIPFYVTLLQGRYWRLPQRGICAECGQSRGKVYARWDGSLYCDHCIEFDLAESRPDGFVQNHPAPLPIEDNTGANRVPPIFYESFA